jgi:competence protein ComEC
VRVVDPAELPDAPPTPDTWRVHLIDVGTGLAVLVHGHDFALLFDAGSSDPGETPARVLDYLGAALGPRRVIDHVVLSHPHLDHASALEEVLDAHDVAHVWDAGRIHDAVFYRDFVAAVGRERGATYHTAAAVPADRTITIKGFAVAIPDDVTWQTFSEGDVVELGAGARFTLLHAEAKAHRDPNRNSIVIMVELGATRLLLTGDAESGPRADPGAPLGDVEAHLVDRFAAEIDVDILQVGHHGSKTSSRRAFLDAVSPSLALISAGPKAFRGTTLPDPEVVAALEAVGATVLRTDEHDASCRGCDSYVITVEAVGGGRAPRRSSAASRETIATPR